MMSMLDRVKLARRVSSAAYDAELEDLIAAGAADLRAAGVIIDDEDEPDALTARAIITYVACHFGTPPDYDRLKASYDEQKMQLMTASGHTDWRDADDP